MLITTGLKKKAMNYFLPLWDGFDGTVLGSSIVTNFVTTS